MAIKDFNGSENQGYESEKIPAEKQDEISPSEKQQKETEQTEIKNAHATGDGSFGRNESRLPDEEVKKEQGNTSY